MAYPGIAFVAMIGVGLGFALWYFLADTGPGQGQGPHSSGSPPPFRAETPSNNSRNAPNDTRRRRRYRNTGGTKEDCSICSEALEQNIVAVNCGHVFHLSCINKWREVVLNLGDPSSSTPRCPLCRERI